MRYASQTHVSADKSKAEIERLLTRYGATSFVAGWQGTQAAILFSMRERRVKFLLPLPDRTSTDFTRSAVRNRQRTEADAYKRWEQATRQRWRALALVVKAKLEAVESNITTFEHEFMAHIVMPDGKTVAEHITPLIASAYTSGKIVPLLPGW